MESQSCRPRAPVASMLSGVRPRVGAVDSEAATLRGSDAWNALRQLMVRGMPLKLMHLSPTSRISSAVCVALAPACAAATSNRTGSASGELRVKVAAAYTRPSAPVRTTRRRREAPDVPRWPATAARPASSAPRPAQWPGTPRPCPAAPRRAPAGQTAR